MPGVFVEIPFFKVTCWNRPRCCNTGKIQTGILAGEFRYRNFDPTLAGLCSQAPVDIVALTGQ